MQVKRRNSNQFSESLWNPTINSNHLILHEGYITYQFIVYALEKAKLQDVDTSSYSDISISAWNATKIKTVLDSFYTTEHTVLDLKWDAFYFVRIFRTIGDTTALQNYAKQYCEGRPFEHCS